MKILHAIESSGPGGAERLLVHLATAQRELGHCVRVLLLHPGWLERELSLEGIDNVSLNISRPLDRRFLMTLRKAIHAFDPDVLHTHEFTYAVYGRAANFGLRTAQVVTAHGSNFATGSKRVLLCKLLLRRRRHFRLVTVSGDLASTLASVLGTSPGALEVIPNGIPFGDPPSASPRTPYTPLRLIAVGNLYPVKNHAMAIRAVGALVGAGMSVNLDILGRGEEEERLRALIAECRLETHVRLLGFRDDVARHLNRAHVFLSTSTHEGMPISFLEAMSCRLPLIAPRVGGVPEMIHDGRHGLLFERDDFEGLVRALRRLAEDEPLRVRLGEQANDHARSQFSLERMIASYSALYEQLRYPAARAIVSR